MIRVIFLAAFTVTVTSACELSVPSYIQADTTWKPAEKMWLAAPMPDSHRLADHMYALSGRPVRRPSAQRRSMPPERRALAPSRQRPAQRGAPGTVKVLAFRKDAKADVVIWVNGIKAGPAPMYLNLPSGLHRFDVYALDGEKQSRQVEVKPRSTQHVVFRFGDAKQ